MSIPNPTLGVKMLEVSKKTEPNRSTKTPAITCPNKKKPDKPCDIEKLVIKDKSGRIVTTSQPLSQRTKPPTGKLKPDRKTLAASYDLVLELIAPFLSKGGASGPASGSNITVIGTWVGACPNKEHPFITFTPLNNGPDDKEKAKAYKAATTEPIPVWGKALECDKKPIPELDFRYYWPFGNNAIKDCQIETCSCGVRLSGKPKSKFTGLVRIYRKEEYELNITVPAFHSWKGERKGYKEDKKSVRETTYERKSGDETKAEHSKKTRAGETVESSVGFTTDDGNYLKVSDKEKKPLEVELVSTKYTKTTSTKTTTTITPAEGKLETETTLKVAPKFSLKRNGRELKITETINQILNLANTLKEAIEAFQKCVPRVGFSMSLEISIMEGTLSGKWGVRPDTVADSGEYKWVSPYLDLTAALSIVKLTFTAMFGLEVKSREIGYWTEGDIFNLTAKIEFKLELEAKLSATFTLGPADDEAKKSHYQGEGKLTFELKGEVNLAGRGFRIRGGIDGGVDVDGYAVYGQNEPFHITWALHRKKWTFSAYVTEPGKGEPSPDYEYELWEEKKNWREGTLLRN